tara:strand:+ start:49 stop:453 length:405 start_codon:yes stop_codon:yes gene_type:complete
MSIFVIIGIFGVLYGLAFLLSRNPEWRATRILFSFRGPFPEHGETFVHYLLRWARFSALISTGFALCLTFVVFVDLPNYVAPYYLEQGALFVCGLGFLLAAVGGIGVLFRALWHVLFPRTYVFDGASQFFTAAA